MSCRILPALVAAALSASVIQFAPAAVPLDVVVHSGQATVMDEGEFSDDFAENFAFDIAPSTRTLILRALLENAIVDPYDPSVWLGDPVPDLQLARFNRRAAEIAEDVRYADFTSPLFVNDNGQAAFRTLLSGDSVSLANDTALYVTNASGAHFAIREGNPAPGTNATFGEFIIGGLDNHGWATLRAGLQPSSEGAGIFRAAYIGISELITRTGDNAPGTQSAFADFGVPLQSSTGQIAFEATLSNVAANTRSGIWGGSPGTLFKIARQGDQATAGGLFFHDIQWTVLRENHIAFLAELRAAPDGATAVASAIFSGPISAFDVLKTTGDQAPGMPAGVVFSGFGLPDVNSDGRIVVDAGLAGPGIVGGNDLSVWIGDASNFTSIAQEGVHAPGTEAGATFAHFDRLWINDLGQATFLADIASGAGASRGLFAYDSLGGLSLIARTGDEIALGVGIMATIHGFEGEPQLNDLGEVIFQVDLSDGLVGPEVILRATIPVPEPNALMLIVIAATFFLWLYTLRQGNCLT